MENISRKVRKIQEEVQLFRSQIKILFDERFEMIVIGATNSGKSTFLLHTTKMQGFFNIAAVRETANIWRFKLDA
jgi:GTP-binding protein EngB required for normal cell division